MRKFGLVILCTIMSMGVYGCNNNSDNKKAESEKTGSKQETKKETKKDGLSEVLPNPEAASSKVGVNNDKTYLTYVYKATKDDFTNYILKCKDKGFTIEKTEKPSDYTAFNKDGYKVNLHYYGTENRYNIELSAPIPIKDFVWPKTDAATLLPAPKSDKGMIEKNTKFELVANVGDTSYGDYKNYIEECKKKGFDVPYGKNDERVFYAKNKDGNVLKIEYKGFQIMNIQYMQVDNIYNSGKKNRKNANISEKLWRFFRRVSAKLFLWKDRKCVKFVGKCLC